MDELIQICQRQIANAELFFEFQLRSAIENKITESIVVEAVCKKMVAKLVSEVEKNESKDFSAEVKQMIESARDEDRTWCSTYNVVASYKMPEMTNPEPTCTNLQLYFENIGGDF